MKRTLSLLLAVLLCSTVFAACAKDNGDTGTDTTAAPIADDTVTTAPEIVDDGKDANGFIRDTLPSDLNFKDETINILTWSDVEHNEFEVEEITGDLVADALYNRNRRVEERLGVKLEFHGVKGNWGNSNEYVTHVNTAIQSGSHDFDMCAAYSMTMATCAYQGFLLNLLDLPYLNFEQPWWPKRLTDEATINDKLFFASGDISANVIYLMYTCFFNKEMIAAYGLENPQDLVKNDQWTYEKYFQMCEGLYKDLNGNGQKDVEDQFAYLTSEGIHVDPFLFNAGVNIVKRNADGGLILDPQFMGEKVISVIELLNRNFWETDDCYFYPTIGTPQKVFSAGNMLFCIDRARLALWYFADTEIDYGIVPCPVISPEQDYVTVVGNPFSLYALPIDCRNPDMMSAVMECYASESYRQVTPALFEITFKIRYSDTDVSSQMFDIIRQGVTFDLGRLFNKQLDAMGRYQNAIKNNQNNWASMTKVVEKLATKSLENIQKAFE